MGLFFLLKEIIFLLSVFFFNFQCWLARNYLSTSIKVLNNRRCLRTYCLWVFFPKYIMFTSRYLCFLWYHIERSSKQVRKKNYEEPVSLVPMYFVKQYYSVTQTLIDFLLTKIKHYSLLHIGTQTFWLFPLIIRMYMKAIDWISISGTDCPV